VTPSLADRSRVLSTPRVAPHDSPWLRDCRQVAATQARFEQLGTSRSALVSPPTPAELEQVLHQPVGGYELLHSNWRNRVYRVELKNDEILILKQVAFGTAATVQGQFEELEALSQLQLPGLRVPKPVGLLPEKRVLIMEFVPGEAITALLSRRAGAEKGLHACDLAGAALAKLHRAWQEALCAFPAVQLAEDMADVPWRLTHAQKETLRSLLAELGGTQVAVGRMHYDYEPDNLLLDGEQLSLVDPSAGRHRGVQLFEVATFCSGLRGRLMMRWARQPLGWQTGLLESAIARFQNGYLAGGGGASVTPELFRLAIRFFELQRLGQMFVAQRAKIDMTRCKKQFGWQMRGVSRNRAQLGLLNVYKHWLFGQVGRELRGKR